VVASPRHGLRDRHGQGGRDRLHHARREPRLQPLLGHRSFLDPDEARFITPGLVEAVCLAGTPEEIVERVRTLEKEGLRQIMLYPPLNRQYRVIEDFASMVMSRL